MTSTLSSPEELAAIDIIFKGLDTKPSRTKEVYDAILSGMVFIELLASVDRLVSLALKDCRADLVAAGESPEQWLKNWKSIHVVLFDYGYELPLEAEFAVLAKELSVAAQLGNDIQRLRDKSFTPQLLHRIGPPVPVRQRLHPFLARSSKSSGIITALPTQVVLLDQQRFTKKRAICVDSLERLREKELKLMKLKEKREREALQRATEANRAKQAEEERAQAEAYLNAIYRDDPEKMAAKSKRTQLLRELERLETDYTTDERRIALLRKDVLLDSPRNRVTPQFSSLALTNHANVTVNSKVGALAPVRLKEKTSIPFFAPPTKKASTIAKPS